MTDFVCDVEESYRSACEGLDSYGEHEGKSYCVLHYPGEHKKDDFEKVKKSKLARKDYDFSGTIFPEGTSYFEGTEFNADMSFAGATFIGEANFTEAQFSGKWTDFTRAQFSGEQTSFSHAQFSGEWASFEGAQFSSRWIDFTDATFSGERTNFTGVQFSGEQTFFPSTQFSGEGTSFPDATFNAGWTNFTEAQFSGTETNFKGTRFSAYTSFVSATFTTKTVRFSKATFRAKAEFWGSGNNSVFDSRAWVWFDSHIEKPELLTFNTVLLHPGWFINVDMRKVDFTDVKWFGMTGGPKGTLDEEIHALKDRGVGSPHTLLSQVCRRLSANAEENHEYPLANEFHYWSMDALRIGRWRYLGWLRQFIEKNWRRISARFGLMATLLWIWRIFRREPLRHGMPSRFGLVPTFYWALNGYGVRAGRAFWMLVTLGVVFAMLYTLSGPAELRVFSAPSWRVLVPFAICPAPLSFALYALQGPPLLELFSVSSFGEILTHCGQALVYSLGAMARLKPAPTPNEPGLFQFLVITEGILGPIQIALLALAIRRKVMR